MQRHDQIDEEYLVFDSIARSKLRPDDHAYLSPAALEALVQLAVRRMDMRAKQNASDLAEAGIDPRL